MREKYCKHKKTTAIGDKCVVLISPRFYHKNELTSYISYNFLIKYYSSSINNIFHKKNKIKKTIRLRFIFISTY